MSYDSKLAREIRILLFDNYPNWYTLKGFYQLFSSYSKDDIQDTIQFLWSRSHIIKRKHNKTRFLEYQFNDSYKAFEHYHLLLKLMQENPKKSFTIIDLLEATEDLRRYQISHALGYLFLMNKITGTEIKGSGFYRYSLLVPDDSN